MPPFTISLLLLELVGRKQQKDWRYQVIQPFSHARLHRLAIKPGEKGALLFRIGFQQPLGHAALTEDNALADKPTPVLLDQLSPFTSVLGNSRR